MSRRPAARWALTSIATAAAIGFGYLPLTRPYDIDVFLRAGTAVLHGGSLYPALGTPAVYAGSAFVYPYLTVGPYVLLALLPHATAVAVAFVLTAAAVALAVRVAGGEALATLLVLGTSFTITGLQLGALSPLLFVGAVLAWRYRDRPWVCALLTAPLIVSKLFLAPMLVWLAVARRWRAFAGASGLTVALLGAGFLVGPLGAGGYLRLLSALSRHEARAGLGLVSLLRNLTLTPRVAEVVAAAAAAAVLAGASRSYSRHGDERVVFAAAVIAALLCTPVLWSHYLVLLAAPLLGLRRPEPALAVLAVGSWALAPPHGASAVAVLVGTGVLLVVAGKVWSRPLASYRSRAPRGRLVGIAAAALATGVLGAAALSGPGRHWLTTVAPGVVNAAAAVAGCLAVLAASNRAGRGATPRAATEGSSGG